jgi:hypothetical protein
MKNGKISEKFPRRKKNSWKQYDIKRKRNSKKIIEKVQNLGIFPKNNFFPKNIFELYFSLYFGNKEKNKVQKYFSEKIFFLEKISKIIYLLGNIFLTNCRKISEVLTPKIFLIIFHISINIFDTKSGNYSENFFKNNSKNFLLFREYFWDKKWELFRKIPPGI